ncbi:hypothetical protein [Streptomyces hygroscopicus]|uniref:hypothetical protein n=1 Tax=Streptomyces hygroscopicus TaxID=1912 RepID=UPI0036D003F0
MKRRLFRHCSHVPGALTPEGQAVVDQFRAMLAALRDPQPWTPGHAQDLAVRIGPFAERAHTRPGDNHGPEMIAVALVHPDTPHDVAYLHGRRLDHTERGWLRCETTAIPGVWRPATRCSPTPPRTRPSPTTSAWPLPATASTSKPAAPTAPATRCCASGPTPRPGAPRR